jgi:hypothetical protein
MFVADWQASGKNLQSATKHPLLRGVNLGIFLISVTSHGTFLSRRGIGVCSDGQPRGIVSAVAVLLSTIFWDKKVKIAILTLATFAALC